MFIGVATRAASRTGGATYYIDATNGSDSSAGTQAAPWQTITKVNAATLRSGDMVRFKRGETWSGSQIIGVSGVTYTDYGSGNRPIIDAQAAQSTAFAATNKARIVLRNIDFRNGTSGPIQFTTCTDISLINCDGSGASNDNLLFITNCQRCSVIGGRYYGNLATTPAAVWCGIEIADGGNDFLISGVTLDTNPTGIGIHNHVTYNVPTNVTVKDCTVTGNTAQGIQVLCQAASAATTITIQDCSITANVGASADGLRIASADSTNYVSGSITIKGCTISGNGQYQAYLNGDDITLHHCVIAGGNRMLRFLNCKRGACYNNTLYEATYLAGYPLLYILGARTDTVLVKNNILMSDDTASLMISTDAGATTGVVADYNLYKQTTSLVRWRWSSTQYTYANWLVNSGQDAHSPTPADPLFVNKATADFHLQGGSSAINTGVVISGITDGYLGAAPDLGYVETA